ncbi:hypothetical protein K432DRAFT_315511, partial [Lepidopterella palustris CBS 459.81]
FKFFQSVQDKYLIKHSKFIHNFDEKGVMLGLIVLARVIISRKNSRERLKNRTILQLGSRELVSVIEIISADGSFLPLFLI